MKLREYLPKEFFESFFDTRAATLLECEVVEINDCGFEHGDKSWPGTHKNVLNWWKLEDGRCVGWNESPTRGWAFPVHGKKKNS